MITNFDVIKNMSVEQLAAYIHNLQETAVKTGKVEDVHYLEMFLKKEVNG